MLFCVLEAQCIQNYSRLGAWQIIKRMRAQPIKRMKVLKEIEVAIPSVQVWESCSDAAIAFGGGEQDEPLAHIVENDLTVNALTEVKYKDFFILIFLFCEGDPELFQRGR